MGNIGALYGCGKVRAGRDLPYGGHEAVARRLAVGLTIATQLHQARRANMEPRMGSKIFHMTAVATLVAVGLAAAGAPASAMVKSGAAPRAKSSMNQARAIALKTFDGTIVKAELEQERGGSGLRYSFDMRRGKTWHEVGVDAVTGRVLENRREGANPKD